jgi:hypothetical protein
MATYEPTIIGVPDFVHERIASQGLTGAAAMFRAEAATSTSAGDTASAAAFNLWNTAIQHSPRYPGRATARNSIMVIRKA